MLRHIALIALFLTGVYMILSHVPTAHKLIWQPFVPAEINGRSTITYYHTGYWFCGPFRTQRSNEVLVSGDIYTDQKTEKTIKIEYFYKENIYLMAHQDDQLDGPYYKWNKVGWREYPISLVHALFKKYPLNPPDCIVENKHPPSKFKMPQLDRYWWSGPFKNVPRELHYD